MPPFDSFNNNGNNFGNIEGTVWFGDALYVSEIWQRPQPAAVAHPARADDGRRDDRVRDSGTNGLAIDSMGRLIGASHTPARSRRST